MLRKLLKEIVQAFKDLLNEREVHYDSPNISPYENATIRLIMAEHARREQEEKNGTMAVRSTVHRGGHTTT